MGRSSGWSGCARRRRSPWAGASAAIAAAASLRHRGEVSRSMSRPAPPSAARIARSASTEPRSERLAIADERRYWQSLEDLAEDPELVARRRQELPDGKTLWEAAGEPGESRRDFLKIMGFSLTTAALASCTPIPERRAVPLVDQPEGLVPGVASRYA